MINLTILLAVAAVLSIATVRLMIRDGRGSRRPPASHFDDLRFRSPTTR